MFLGKWEPYINAHHAGWYELPPGLKTDLESFRADGSEMEPLTSGGFEQALRHVLNLAATSVKDMPVVYHVPSHFQEVLMDGDDLIGAYETLTHIQLPTLVKQTFALACAEHDMGHPGATFRSEASGQIILPQLGVDRSVEEVSAIISDNHAWITGLNPAARLAKTIWIWATTFGATAPRGKELGLDRIQPTSFLEHAIGLADIAPSDNFTR